MASRFRPLALLALALALVAPPASQADTVKVRYGPYTVPAAAGDMPGMLERVQLAVRRPCSDCFITSFRPNLTYADGGTANHDTGAMLHHMVMTSQFRADATCSSTWLGLAGERFFASGNERSAIELPSGYGYRVRWYDSWNLLVDLMNMEPTSQALYVDVTFTTRSRWASLKPVKPLWLDIDNCGDSEYWIPAGPWETQRDWSATLEGELVSIVGHVHDTGVRIEATNESNGGQSICDSVAEYDDMGHVMAMRACKGAPLALIDEGDVVRLHSHYNSPTERDDVMGIMLGYVHRTSVP